MLNIDSQTIGLIIDVALVFGVLLLWLSWHRNGTRQQRMEQILVDTAHQLEEASRHLNQATQAIEHLKQQEKKSPPKAVGRQQARTLQHKDSAPAAPPENSTQATMVLRMKREGESPESIAEKLGMPLGQVRLLLKLHAASSLAE